jgi:hypothetical protein
MHFYFPLSLLLILRFDSFLIWSFTPFDSNHPLLSMLLSSSVLHFNEQAVEKPEQALFRGFHSWSWILGSFPSSNQQLSRKPHNMFKNVMLIGGSEDSDRLNMIDCFMCIERIVKLRDCRSLIIISFEMWYFSWNVRCFMIIQTFSDLPFDDGRHYDDALRHGLSG